MLFFALILITILVIPNILILFLIKKLFSDNKKGNNLENISVIVSAKNEAKNIETLVNQLKNLNYPPDKFEVILVDDNSTDETIRLMKDFTTSMPNCKVLSIKLPGSAGKREALSVGIQKANYPYILITDADCHPESNWLRSYSLKFEQGYEMLFGNAPFYQRQNLVNRISCFENLRSSILSFSMASIGLPYSAAARNFGFTKKAFETIGGYTKTKETKSGDDDLLLREAVKQKLKIGIVTQPDSFVFSKTKNNFSEYLRQKARHTQTSFHYLGRHQLMLGFWHLLNLFFLLSPLMMFANPLIGLLFPSKLMIDLLVVKSTQKQFSYKFSLIKILYLQIFYEILLVVHILNSRFAEIKWK
jgi:cellulose synthase/poly-beta-1,6-N-acetylglucosamine synthase-like glycosyltransferase